MDRKDLKILALKERISKLTTDYEDQAADYRVEITMLSNEVQELKKQLELAKEPDAGVKEDPGFSDDGN